MLKPESPLEKPKTIVIAGYFGFGNLGDELILVSMINGLCAQQNDLSIVVLSGNPKSTSKTHRVKSITWEDYAGIVQAVSTCDLVILGGGGLFHDYWGVEPGTIFT
ncbi:MAG: polysaccharide pyruvyl transferase family protein, partial [Anaerolineaceae bacterium]